MISKSDVLPGTHITAVGSDTPEKRELDPAILGIAHCIVVDSISQCRERGETKYALDDKIITEKDLIELGIVIEEYKVGMVTRSNGYMKKNTNPTLF